MKIQPTDQKQFSRLTLRLSRGALGAIALALCLPTLGEAQTILGTTGSYGVMGGTTLTINGTAAGTSITGGLAAPGTVAGAQATNYLLNGSPGPAIPGAMTGQDQTDFTRAFNGLSGMTPTQVLTGLDLGGMTLTPGVYSFGAGAAALTGTLTLDAQNQANAVWVFQIGTTFGASEAANVVVTNATGASVANYGIFWRVGTATTVGTGATLEGNFLGGTTFTLGTGASIAHGRILAGTVAGAVTLDNNTINFAAANSGYSGGLAFVDSGSTLTAVPEPSTYALFAAVAVLGFAGWRRRTAA